MRHTIGPRPADGKQPVGLQRFPAVLPLPEESGRGARYMNLEKVIFGFFILLAATLNFGFVYGEIDNPLHHNQWEFFAAFVVNIVATVLKFGDRTHVGAIHLATSLVAFLQLAVGAVLWFFAPVDANGLIGPGDMSEIVSLAAGALLANVVSVTILIVETTLQRR
jgi:Ca2+/H+ antiporter, TMEM165/GDT1 family